MKKYKLFINLEKEEQWLNQMAREGYIFVSKSQGYRFYRAEPEDAVYKIDFRTFKRREDFEDYKALFYDSGWVHISGKKSSGAQYFKKSDMAVSDDIFSDTVSKATRYRRMSELWLTLACGFIPLLVVLILTDTIDVSAFLDPKSLYYTPGLWDKMGIDFWRAFLFETPFAMLRGFLWLIFPLTIILYLVFALKARIEYTVASQKI